MRIPRNSPRSIPERRSFPTKLTYRRTNSFFQLPQALYSQHFFALASFRVLRVICCAPPHHLSTSLRHPSAPFNLHRARVRRDRGRLPSSRCIESAQTRHARAPTLLHRASDTTLGLPGTDRPLLTWIVGLHQRNGALAELLKRDFQRTKFLRAQFR